VAAEEMTALPLPNVLILLTVAAINAFAVMWTVEAWLKR
jgi:hypothetical protein